MVCNPPSWRPSKRLWFVLAALLANVTLASWILFSTAKTSLPTTEEQNKQQPQEEPILFKKLLQETMVKETVEQSIENLPNFDDTVPAMASGGNSYDEITPSAYAYARHYYQDLNRVRKILEEGGAHPDHVIPIFKAKLVHARDDHKQIVEEYWKDTNSHDPIVNTRWNAFQKRRISISCSVYLLTEFGAYETLPLMAKLFSVQNDAKLFASQHTMPIGYLYVYGAVTNQLFLFYSMHHLARNHPRDKLSPQAVKLLDEYLAASKEIQPFKEVLVPSWRATFDPWDYRITILHKDIGMDKQPHIRMHQYPQTRPYLEDMGAAPAPKVHAWFAKLKRFIDEAYPADAPPPSKTKGT